MDDSRETFGNHAFVIGHPIQHSRSPIIHGYWLKTLGLEGSYRAKDVPPDQLRAFIDGLKNGTSPFVGGNVTIPHKEAVFRLADKADRISSELGAANTLWLEDGQLHATNTDGIGFTANLDARAPGWDDVETAIILGAGGASRSILQAVRDRGVKTIHLVNRTRERAQELADRFGRERIKVHDMEAIDGLMSEAGLFINTTSLGMDGGPVPDFAFSKLRAGAIVTDIVYVPLITPILAQAEAHGVRIVDGLGMLLHQAAPGFARWFGQMPEVTDELRALVVADMDRHG